MILKIRFIQSYTLYIDVLWVLLLCNRIKWQFIVIQIQILSNAKCYTILQFSHGDSFKLKRIPSEEEECALMIQSG